MTDEVTPTPMPAAIRRRFEKGRRGVTYPDRERRRHRNQHGEAEAVDAAAGRNAMAEHDVQNEQRAVGEGEDIAQRSGRQPHVGQDRDAGDGDHQGGEIARRPDAESGETDRAEKLMAPTVPSGSRSIAR